MGKKPLFPPLSFPSLTYVFYFLTKLLKLGALWDEYKRMAAARKYSHVKVPSLQSSVEEMRRDLYTNFYGIFFKNIYIFLFLPHTQFFISMLLYPLYNPLRK